MPRKFLISLRWNRRKKNEAKTSLKTPWRERGFLTFIFASFLRSRQPKKNEGKMKQKNPLTERA